MAGTVLPAAAATTPGQGGYGHYLAGWIAHKNGDFPTALDHMNHAYRLDGNADARRRAYLTALTNGQVKHAEMIARDILDRFPSRSDFLDIEKNKAIANDGDATLFYWIAFQRGIDALRNLDYATAEKYFAHAETSNVPPQAMAGALLRIWAIFGSGKRDEAITMAKNPSTSQRYHAHGVYRFHHALLLHVDGKDESARRIITGQKQAGSLLAWPFAIYQKALIDDHHNRTIINALHGAGAAILHAGYDSQIQGFYEDGLRYGRMAEYLMPDFAPGALLSGQCLERLGNAGAAIRAYESIPISNPLSRQARIAAALAHNHIDKPDRALEKLQKLATQYQKDNEILNLLGNQLQAMERFKQAVAIYDRILADVDETTRNADFWHLYYARAIALERSGNWPRSEQDLQRALTLRPNDPYVINYLAYAWADRNQNLDQAQTLLKTALAHRPDDGHIIDSYGWTLFRQGDFDQAVRYLERAAEILPLETDVNHHLADALAKVGRRREARYHWRRALNLSPDRGDKMALQRKLSADLP